MTDQDNVTYSRAGRRITRRQSSAEITVEEAAMAMEIESAEEREHGVRCSFRWGHEQLDLVKQVADKIGIPYQTYMKQAIYRQCIEDLQRFSQSQMSSPAVPEQARTTFDTTVSEPGPDFYSAVGRPRKVLLSMPSSMLDHIDYTARREHRTRSDLVREAVRRYLLSADARSQSSDVVIDRSK